MNEDGKIVETKDTQPVSTQQDTKEEPQKEIKAEPKYTDADIDRIISQKFAKWQKEKDREISEAQKLAEMNAQQKAEYERDMLQKKLDELMERDTLSQMRSEARKELSGAGINIADELLAVIVTKDAEQTKAAVEAFKTMWQGAIQSALKEALRGDVPRSGNPSGLTREDILKVEDRKERQRLMNENKELFT